MRKKILTLLLLAACNSPAPVAAPEATNASGPVQTVGVYARVNIDNAMSDLGTTDLKPLYQELLRNKAVSGLTLGVHWTDLSTGGVDSFDGSILDDAFTVAQNHNKTIKLTLSPGIWLPPWMTDATNKFLTSCDGFFDGETDKMSSTCGTVTFEVFPEQNGRPYTPFPLPWNTNYQTHWTTALQNLSRYAAAYPGVLAGVDVAGPTGVSPEFILPSSTKPQPGCDPRITCPTATYTDVDIWGTLMQKTLGLSPPYDDQPFVDAWNAFVKIYNTQLGGITLALVADTASALPNFDPAFNVPSVYCSDGSAPCNSIVNGVLLALPPAGNNIFATELGGLTASTGRKPADVDYSLPGIKIMAKKTGLLAGADFDHGITDGTGRSSNFCQMGQLPGETCPTTPEAAIYNVLSTAFYGTPAAAVLSPDPSVPTNQGPLHYMVVDYHDIVYADSNPYQCGQVVIGGNTVNVTAQWLLQTAAHQLGVMAKIANPVPAPDGPLCQNCIPACEPLSGLRCDWGRCCPITGCAP